MRDKIFFAVCFGFIFGVFLRSFTSLDLYFVTFLAFLSLILITLFCYFTKLKLGIVVGVFVLGISFGVLRFHVSDFISPAVFESQVDKKVTFGGIIVNEPDIREKNQKLTIKVETSGAETKILITTNFEQDFNYGDEVNFSGKLEKPENFLTGQGKNFDYINYLRKDGIFYLVNYPDVEVISVGHGNKIKSSLISVKNKFLRGVNKVISPPESLLMGGLILGERSAFSDELREKFIDTGTIHVVALSGYNVTIVAEWFMKLFSAIPYGPKNLGIFGGIFMIFLFVLMTGASSTAVRAGIMATLALVARATGRNYDVGRALILAGVIMILLNPYVLVYDVSFQLSFIATIAVIFFTPKIEKYFLWVTKSFGLRDVVSVTCAAYIFVLPFILYKMGNLSLVALPANILILPFIPLTMGLGFLTGFVGLISHLLSVPMGYLSSLFLHYELGVVDFFSRIPLASITIPDFPLFLTILIYLYFIWKLFGNFLRSHPN